MAGCGVVGAAGLVLLYPASCWALPTVVPAVYPRPLETPMCRTLLDVNTPPFGADGRSGAAIAAVVVAVLAAAMVWALVNRLRSRAERNPAARTSDTGADA